MAVSYMDYASPDAVFAYDVNKNRFFTKNNQNFINMLSIKQLNTLGNVSLLDIHLSTGNVVEPHIHQNASELVYCIAGAAVVSLLNPFTKEILNFPITPGQVANVPQGWWHYEIATVDNTHLLAIFDAPTPEFIGGSDLFRLTPASVLAHTYCLDEKLVKETFAPIKDTVFIGPPTDCKKELPHHKPAEHHHHHGYAQPAQTSQSAQGHYHPQAPAQVHIHPYRQHYYYQGQQSAIGNGGYVHPHQNGFGTDV
ncbi:quercetin dioxygenase-like cupin family protein [Paenibacillus phyllosphaerae]|uniref:Quercetin dioxygenase-like cupin family protein n=1 Tax=Paenibacillus phyllosphaerae TaxID=274593 RepID=A0A7W5FM57_9BACL|nr:cupin domain-containing protein [Paenibacillus phyllosphaerae]MBB3109737.1 quercetin dioxygenase-like cupin family protein [Paenibacillus phyllosphaerae]